MGLHCYCYRHRWLAGHSAALVSAPPERLGRVGIAVHMTCRGSGGRNLQDHYIARISYAVEGVATVNERSRAIPLAAEVLRYLVTGKGMLTYAPRSPRFRSRCSRYRRRATCSAASTPASPPAPGTCGLVARLSRGAIAKPGRGAGDQPAFSVRPDRPPRDHRRPTVRPPPLCRPSARALLRCRDPAGYGGQERPTSCSIMRGRRARPSIT